MHVLITGLNGFTGYYLQQELLEQGHTVVGLQSDLTDAHAVAKEIAHIRPQAVIHLGGISFVQHQDVNVIYHVNVLGTRNLLASIAESAPEVSSVILASTGNVYGNSHDSVLTETSSMHPANDYAVSKAAMEQMAALWMDKLPICIVRPFNYTGVRQAERFLIPKIVSHFKMKKPKIELGNLDVAREFGDVRVVAEIYRKILDAKLSGQTMNICTGRAYSLEKVISLCEEITGHTIQVDINPLFVRNNEVRVLTGSHEKLKQCIGDWTDISFEETLRWMLCA